MATELDLVAIARRSRLAKEAPFAIVEGLVMDNRTFFLKNGPDDVAGLLLALWVTFQGLARRSSLLDDLLQSSLAEVQAALEELRKPTQKGENV